ncbi:hypothetical protein, partial [Intrasporangium chromatireducens]
PGPHARSRLALLAMAKMAAIGALLGIVIGIGMAVAGETPWSILLSPFAVGLLLGITLGPVVALNWYLLPGRVTYQVTDASLTAWRGGWRRKEIQVGRIADIHFDEQITWKDLVFSGWFGYSSPIPRLWVTLTATQDRWDPSNSAAENLPSILIAAERQRQAMLELRQALNLPLNG